jgi:hypothetical protein
MAEMNQSLSISSDSAIVIDFPVDKSRASQGLSIGQTATAKFDVAASSSSSIRIKQTTSIKFKIFGSSDGSIGIGQTAKGRPSYPAHLRTPDVVHVPGERRVASVLAEVRRQSVEYENRLAKVR